MFKKKYIIFACLFIITTLSNAKIIKPEAKEIVVGENHLKINLELWNAQLDGKIENLESITNIKKDLGYKSQVISFFGGELSTNYVWLPDVKIDYFLFDSTKNYYLNKTKTIYDYTKNPFSKVDFNGSVTTNTKYSELNSRIFGYMKNEYFKIDLGVNLKKVNYTQKIVNNQNKDFIIIKGPSSLLFLPYVSVTLDLGFLKLNANTSIKSFGDDRAKDYEYSISLTTFKAVEFFGGYRYHEWDKPDKYNSAQHYSVKIYGGYFGMRLIF